jgi:hypothetical protein
MANRIIGRSLLKKQHVSSRRVMTDIYRNAFAEPVVTDCPEVCINAGFAYLSYGKEMYSKQAKEYFLTAQKLDIDNLYEYEIKSGLKQATDSSTHATEFYAYYLEE